MSPPPNQSCPNCGGPLPAAMGPTVQCGFCGSTVTVGAPAPPQWPSGPPVQVTGAASPDHMRRIMIIVIISVVAPIVLTVVISIAVVLATSCAICGAAGATGMAVSQSPTGIVPTPWTGSTPLVCTGNQHLTYTAVVASQGVNATGNCQLTLVATTINATLPINASGNARVTLQGGSFQGNPIAINASGNATVVARGARVVGMVNRSGNATVTGVQ